VLGFLLPRPINLVLFRKFEQAESNIA